MGCHYFVIFYFRIRKIIFVFYYFVPQGIPCCYLHLLYLSVPIYFLSHLTVIIDMLSIYLYNLSYDVLSSGKRKIKTINHEFPNMCFYGKYCQRCRRQNFICANIMWLNHVLLQIERHFNIRL